MKYNSKIMLRGDKEPVYVSKSSATGVQKIFLDENEPKDKPIMVNKRSFLKGEIRSISVENDSLYDDEKFDMKHIEEEERIRHSKFISLKPEIKASYMSFFLLFYKCATGSSPKYDVVKIARDAQLKFFLQNPKRRLCDVSIYKNTLPSKFNRRMSVWESGSMSIIENAIRRDIMLSLK